MPRPRAPTSKRRRSADPEFGEPHLGLGLVYFRDEPDRRRAARDADGDAARTEGRAVPELSRQGVLPGAALSRRPVGAGVGQAPRPARPDAVALRELLPARSEPAGGGARRAAAGHRAQRSPRRLPQPAAARPRPGDEERQPRGDLPAARIRGVGRVRSAELARDWTSPTPAPTSSSPRPTAGLPDRTQALGSELLQYFLYAPVNRNSFNNFAEYTALLEQPRRQFDGRRRRPEAASARSATSCIAAATSASPMSPSSSWRTRTALGSTERDDRLQGFFQGKLALGRRSDLFFSFTGVRNETGASTDDHAHASAWRSARPSSCVSSSSGPNRRSPPTSPTRRRRSA